MEFAINEKGMRISAYDANKNDVYKCPCCGAEVILRAGDINCWHFAHKTSECLDTWNYDMSEWHHKMQGFFDPQYREVVISHNGETHRADILKDGVVIEFQHSPISGSEFCERNKFYTEAGYRLAWVFDVTTQWKIGNISYLGDDDDNKLVWKHPLRILKLGPIPQDKDDKISICISKTFEECEEEEETWYYTARVLWSTLDDDHRPDYRRIAINDDCYFEMGYNMNANIFMYLPSDFVRESIKQYVPNGVPYKIKIRGHLKGYPKDSYRCDITNDWIDEYKCNNCKFCAFHENKHINKYDTIDKYYCCYPKVICAERDFVTHTHFIESVPSIHH